MSKAIETYLDRVMLYANRRNPDEAARIRSEQQDHLLQKVDRFEAEGLPREDAIFQAIEDHGSPRIVGYGLRPKFPLIDIRTHGTARGVIAIGPRAVGVVASGGLAIGVVTFAGAGIGLVGMGGVMLAAFYAYAGLGIAPFGLAYAGLAIGLIAVGGFAIGGLAVGGVSIAMWPDTDLPLWLTRSSPIWFAATNVVAFVVLWFAMMLASRSEQKRLRDSDANLVE